MSSLSKALFLSFAFALLEIAARPLQYTFNTKLDHHTLSDTRTFKLRYLVDDQYFHTGSTGKLFPIFFYAGNEGDIWSFYQNSGFMTTTLANEFGALVVFGEHRYFGQSFPFPQSQALQAPYNQYLTVE
jgi:hypothetical protein